MRVFIFTLFLFVTIASFGESDPKEKHIKVIFTSRDIFYFKVDHHWIGGDIEIYTDSGKRIAVEPIARHKMIVDFVDMAPGNYVVKVKKGDMEEDFKYTKSDIDNESSNKVAFYSTDPLLRIDLRLNFKKNASFNTHHAHGHHSMPQAEASKPQL